MVAELLGKRTGYYGGRGGSMHIADVKAGNLGANGIVAAAVPGVEKISVRNREGNHVTRAGRIKSYKPMLTVCAVVACMSIMAPMAEGTTFPPPTPEFEGLVISLVTDKEVYEIGETVYVTFLATNTLDDTWTFTCETDMGVPWGLPEDSPVAADDLFEVQGQFFLFNGHDLPWTIQILPLGALQRSYTWNTGSAMYEDPDPEVYEWHYLVSPGDYTLTVTFAEQEFSKTVTVVPEPATLAMIGLGLASLVFRGKRRQ